MSRGADLGNQTRDGSEGTFRPRATGCRKVPLLREGGDMYEPTRKIVREGQDVILTFFGRSPSKPHPGGGGCGGCVVSTMKDELDAAISRRGSLDAPLAAAFVVAHGEQRGVKKNKKRCSPGFESQPVNGSATNLEGLGVASENAVWLGQPRLGGLGVA
jgi:hypothetical protein